MEINLENLYVGISAYGVNHKNKLGLEKHDDSAPFPLPHPGSDWLFRFAFSHQ